MYIDLIQTITMTIATIIYSLKNVKHLSLFYGLIQCSQKVKDNDDENVKNLENQINLLEEQLFLTTESLKKLKNCKITPRNNEDEIV